MSWPADANSATRGDLLDARVGRKGKLARRLRPFLRRAAYGFGGLVLAAYLLIYVVPLPALPPVPPLDESLKIYDRDGRLLYDSAGPADTHYTRATLAELPIALRQAVLATEDRSFYSHPGIDPRAIGRAVFDNATHLALRSGGSTITQQLARNLYLPAADRASRNPLRKLRESYIALRMERAWSKDEILESYLNRVYFGNLAYGVEAASRTYFGKSARDLDLAECALLAGLLQSPSAYDPLRHFEAAKARQGLVLGLMAEAGYIGGREAAAARDEKLRLNATPFPIEAPHFVAWVMEQLPRLAGEARLAKGGLRVYTSLDLPLQQTAQASLAWQIEQLKDSNVTTGAVVVIDPADGGVLALVGSADYFDPRAGAVNGALAQRQPGSSIKPIVYAAALEQGFSPSTPLLDVPTSFRTRQGEVYTPNNYDLSFHGVVPLREALASSYNVPAVRVLDAVGVENAVRLAQRFGLTSLRDPEQYDLSLTLGGGEVRLLDLTAAYAAFANGGLRIDPVAVLRIEDAAGRPVYAAPGPAAERRVVSAATAYLISDVLSDNEARAPSFGLYSPLRLNRPAAAKTGTTTDFRDNWTVGYTPDLVAGVWVGNADGSAMRNVSGVDGAAPVWRDVMQAGLKQRPASAFVAPAGIETAEVCLPSGLLPTPDCLRRRVEVFAAGAIPSRYDDYYRRSPACDGRDAACSARVLAAVPLEAVPGARGAGIDLAPSISAPSPFAGVTPATETCRSAATCALTLVTPADGLVLSISRDLARGDQVLPVEALPASPVRYVELWVGGERLGRVESAPYRLFWPLRPGTFEVKARAVDAAGAELWSAPARVQVLAP